MPSRAPGEPDPAAELLGRWQSHHAGTPGTPGPAADQVAPTEAPGPAPEAPEPRHARAPLGRRRTPAPRGTDQTAAGRDVVRALEATPPRRLEPTPAPAATPATTPAPPARRATAPASPSTGRSTDVEFEPRTGARRVTGALLLALLPLTAAAGYLAYDQQSTLTVGVAGTLLLLTLAVYGVRAGSTPTRLAIHGGQLEVVRGSSREVFDLTSRFTRLEVVGEPGRRGWKVLMARFGRDPLVIDASVVDPAAFTAALERHRPHAS